MNRRRWLATAIVLVGLWLTGGPATAAPPGQNQTWADGQHPGTLVVVHY